MRFILVCLGLLATGVPAAGQDSISQADLLRRLIDLDRLATPPAAGERTGLFSSFDRRQGTIRDGRYVHWDANNDRGQFVRVTEDGWNVMAELDQPGALTRIWCTQPAGDVRITLDGEDVIAAPLVDLFNGAVEPFGIPLTYEIPPGTAAISFFPIAFSKSCRVLSRGFEGEYQIDYVTFPAGTQVERFRPELNSAARSALDVVVKAFKDGLSNRQLFKGHPTGWYGGAPPDRLQHGDRFAWDVKGAGTIRAFYVSLTDKYGPRELYALHKIILRIHWDGHSEPDIEVPLAQFFGTGYERNLYNSLVMGTDLGTRMPGESPNEGWFMYCYFPMQFTDGVHIEFENLNRKRVGMMFYMRIVRDAPPSAALRFKVRAQKADPCQTFDFPILETSGAGRLVGCVLNVDCPRDQWWGDGDHKVWIDREPFPSILGTSTAGYFGNLTGLRAFRMPLHGATRVSTPGKSSVYRWHIPDCVNFQEAIQFKLENWQVNRANDVYYNTVVYWYGQPDAPASFKRLSEEMLELPGLRIPGAVEIEGNIAADDWGSLYQQKHARGVELSGQLAATITATDPLPVDIPWDRPGRYRLSVRVVPGRSFGSIRVVTADGDVVGTVEYSRRPDGIHRVGEIELQGGKTRVLVTCSRAPILDCWVVEPLGD